METKLEQLARGIDATGELDAVVDALYAIRAPRTLEGIVPACRQLRDWRQAYPALNVFPELPHYAQRLEWLDRIADLELDDDHLMGRTIRRIKNAWTPLFNVTGDSVIGELLLVQANAEKSPDNFERASVWLLWQAQRFQLRFTRRTAYAAYLTSDGGRLATHVPGRRLYEAYLALRSFASDEPDAQDKLAAFLHLIPEMTAACSTRVAQWFRLASERLAQFDRLRLERHVRDESGVGRQELDEVVAHVRQVVPQRLGRLLVTLWLGDRARASSSRWQQRGFLGRELDRPLIIHGERLTEVLQQVGGGDTYSGTVVEFYPLTPDVGGGPRTRDPNDVTEDDPVEPAQQDPALSLFLANEKELIRGYYAARGQQTAIEYANAMLRWSKWTLSRPALDIVVDAVVTPPATPESSVDRRARLALGLMLVTGRPLLDVAGFRIASERLDVSQDAPLAIGLERHLLYLYPGQPDLRHPPADTLPFCYPRARVLSLPLPKDWWMLADAIGADDDIRPATVATALRHKLRAIGKSFPDASALRVTEHGIRYAFLRALAERTCGDLGTQQVLTNVAEADSRNIIHYGSYPAPSLESTWRSAAESLVGPLPSAGSPAERVRYVGAQHAFNMVELAAYFRSIRGRIDAAKRKNDWPRLFNLMTLYLTYWLGLGLASRKTLAPVPNIVLKDGWALVADKHRVDGSTDRLVPLTEALREQITAYVAFARELSITAPQLDPLVHTERGRELRLQYIHLTQGVVPYQPKYQEQDEQLRPLPANWGRKVVRSQSGALPGRYRDAELGHWVRGRHAWDATSTFQVEDFRLRWLALQSDLEARLGFELVRPVPVTRAIRLAPLRPAVKSAPARVVQTKPAPVSAAVDVEALFRDVDSKLIARLLDPKQAVDPHIALDLARRVVGSQERESVERQRQVAEAVCKWLRDHKGIAIFASKPRPLFTNKVVLSASALQTLGYLQQDVLPAFRRDLECLPPPPRDDAVVAGRQACSAELGRLVMIGIWRLGLARWSLLECWLRALHEGACILAQGPNRYLVVAAHSARDVTRRTVFLDDFTCAYLVAEHDRLQQALLRPLFGATTPVRRRARVERAISDYLRFMGVDRYCVSLTQMTAAAVQSIMLHSAPVVAAYARGELDTWDLGDRQLRRLGGLQSARDSGVDATPELPAFKQLTLGDSDLPEEIRRRVPILRAIRYHSSPYKSEWRRLIQSYRPTSPVERLMCSFALWLLDQGDQEHDAKLSAHARHYLTARIKIVTYAWLGFADPVAEPTCIDGDMLGDLQEATRDEFPDRLQNGAWVQFHRFLSDPDADHAGFEIGALGPPPDRAVSAKILSAEELAELLEQLPSVRSRIARPTLRTSAQHHVELMATYGMRRAESAYLRGIDHQVDLCRVQPYGHHTLKTAWSDRVLPIEFAEPWTQSWLHEAQRKHYAQLIDAAPASPVNPDNFFVRINQLVKHGTGDAGMGSHHLRHTLVSRLALSLLWDVAGLEQLADDLPWLRGLRIAPERMRTLLGAEGDAGQGLRAVAALVGHSHPSTTIRHYVHVLGIALHGALVKADTLDLAHSFEDRIGGKSTVQRWVTHARASLPSGIDAETRRRMVNRALRDRIEQRFHGNGIDRDGTPRAISAPEELSDDAISLTRLEQVDQSLRDGEPRLDPEALETYRQGLRWLAGIATGKKGRKATHRRHPLIQERPGVWLPEPLAAGSAADAADALCRWLELLRTTRPDDFVWLLEKWVRASEHERSRMRLDTADEVTRASTLADPRWGTVRVEGAIVATARVRLATKEIPRLRLKCLDQSGKLINRDILASRWVLSYVAAYDHMQRVAAARSSLSPGSQLDLFDLAADGK